MRILFQEPGGISSGPLALFGFNDVSCLIAPGRVTTREPRVGLGESPTAGILVRFSLV